MSPYVEQRVYDLSQTKIYRQFNAILVNLGTDITVHIFILMRCTIFRSCTCNAAK